jgi:PRTRC genetic system protein C
MKNTYAGGNTPTYPEIATATLTGPEDTGTALRYSFSRAIGSKG